MCVEDSGRRTTTAKWGKSRIQVCGVLVTNLTTAKVGDRSTLLTAGGEMSNTAESSSAEEAGNRCVLLVVRIM